MDQQRLRVKIGDHEFEAEGPPEAVAAQFEAWRELIGQQPTKAPEQGDEGDTDQQRDTSTPTDLPSIFDFDKRRRVLSLRVHPRGERRHADAALLVLYGHRILGHDEVIVGGIKESLAVSGLRVDRVDRIMAPHQTANLVLKGGTGKGGKYRLTNTGVERAKALVRELEGT